MIDKTLFVEAPDRYPGVVVVRRWKEGGLAPLPPGPHCLALPTELHLQQTAFDFDIEQNALPIPLALVEQFEMEAQAEARKAFVQRKAGGEIEAFVQDFNARLDARQALARRNLTHF